MKILTNLGALKITTILKVNIAALFLLSLLSTGFLFYQLQKMGSDGTVVNYAGKQRMLSQRITKLVFARHAGVDNGEKIAEFESQMDRIVHGLINGDPELGLPMAADENFIKKMKEVESVWNEFKDAITRAANDPKVLKECLDDSENFLKVADEATNIASAAADSKVKTLKIMQIITLLLTVLVLSFIFIISQKKIANPLRRLTEIAEEISEGNLKVEIPVNNHGDEISVLSNAINRMVGSLNNVLNTISVAASNVISTVDVLKEGSNKTLEGARTQSGQAHQIATAAEEMSQTITDIARNASTASASSSEALEIAESGKEVTEIAVETINKVYESTVELSTLIERLGKRSGEIGDIVTLIKDIADQTNLLALNAAIEAARAGEQGRGFAVVADEVRKLAERTIKATGEISEKISAVQKESEQTSSSMAEASKNVTKATGHVKNLSNVLQAIVESVHKVRDEITQIAAAVDEQSAASEEVARNIEKTSAISKEMEKMAGDVLHQVSALTKVAEDLRNSTGGFRTKGNEFMILDLAKGDHRTWVNKVAAHLRGDERLDPEKLADHTTCRFGRWYYGEGMQVCGGIKAFKEIESYHDRVHSLGKEIVSLYNSGDKAKAERLFKEMEDTSAHVIKLLDEIKRECKNINN